MNMLHITSTPPPRFLTFLLIVSFFSLLLTGCSSVDVSQQENNASVETSDTANLFITQMDFSSDTEFWKYAEEKYPLTPIEEIRSGNKKMEVVLVDALFLGVTEESSITNKYYIGYKFADGTYQCFSQYFKPAVNNLMTDVSIMDSLKQGDTIRICARIPNGDYVSFDSMYGLKITGHDENALKIALNISDNPLMNLKVETENVLNGNKDSAIGKRAFVKIAKDDMRNITQEQYAEFVETRVNDSGYNWYSIIFTDGTGIQWAGSLGSYGTYGEMDFEGCITKSIGDIQLLNDQYTYTPVAVK